MGCHWASKPYYYSYIAFWAGPKIGGVALPICAVIKLEWAVIKLKLGSITGRVTSALLVNQYPTQKKLISGNKSCYIKSLTSNRR